MFSFLKYTFIKKKIIINTVCKIGNKYKNKIKNGVDDIMKENLKFDTPYTFK